jgi:hypothetical protein
MKNVIFFSRQIPICLTALTYFSSLLPDKTALGCLFLSIKMVVFFEIFHIFIPINRDLTMKRLLSSVVLLIISSFVCLAQTDESRHEISVSYGHFTLPQAIDFIGAGGGEVLGGLLVGIVDVMAPGEQEYPKRIDNGGTGALSFQYLYSLNRTIKLGGTVCYESTWGEWNDGNDYIVHYPAIMATSKFMWFNREHFGMYSKLSLGMMLLLDGKNEDKPIPMLAGQASSVCMEFGGKTIRGFLETGWGNQGLLNFGVRIFISRP